MRGADLKSTHRARALRRRSTRAEWVLWLALRDRRLAGLKFARQQPLGPYYADFVCREQRLIVEVDGGQHADNPADRKRDDYLRALGYRVIRVWNNEVLGNLGGVLEMLMSELKIAPHPVPLPAGGERERSGDGSEI
jgi:very-short-patch-repair endonuclease